MEPVASHPIMPASAPPPALGIQPRLHIPRRKRKMDGTPTTDLEHFMRDLHRLAQCDDYTQRGEYCSDLARAMLVNLTAKDDRILELEHLCGLMVQTIRPHFPSLADSYTEQISPAPPSKDIRSQS